VRTSARELAEWEQFYLLEAEGSVMNALKHRALQRLGAKKPIR